jgi:hypothetical protein
MKVIDILTESFTLTVPQGNKGPAVADLQKALVALGYPLPKFGVDGVRGKETSAAVRNFQQANNIRVDGIPGPETIATLNKVLAANPQVATSLRKSTPAEVKPRGPAPAAKKAAPVASTINVDAVMAQIRRAEGGKMGYDAVNKGKAGDTPNGMPGLSNLTINQVRQLQRERRIFAAGAYQIIPGTMDMILSNGVVDSSSKFDKETQDKMGRWLIDRRIRIAQRNGTDPQLELAKEFASIANPSTGQSYYKNVGNNKASIASLSGTGNANIA